MFYFMYLYFFFFLIIFEFVFIYFLDHGEEAEEGEQDDTPAEEDKTLASGNINDFLFSNFTLS